MMTACLKCGYPSFEFENAELFYCESKDAATMKFTLHSDASMSEEAVPSEDDLPGLTLVLQLRCASCKRPCFEETLLWSPYL
jgi:hypothetical protein